MLPSFMVQFGLNGDPDVSASWRAKTINDEPVKVTNKPGAAAQPCGLSLSSLCRLPPLQRTNCPAQGHHLARHAGAEASPPGLLLPCPCRHVHRGWHHHRAHDTTPTGYMTFAKTGAPNSRTTQLFINYVTACNPCNPCNPVPPRCSPVPPACHRMPPAQVDNGRLDGMGFAPFAEVEGDGMEVPP